MFFSVIFFFHFYVHWLGLGGSNALLSSPPSILTPTAVSYRLVFTLLDKVNLQAVNKAVRPRTNAPEKLGHRKAGEERDTAWRGVSLVVAWVALFRCVVPPPIALSLGSCSVTACCCGLVIGALNEGPQSASSFPNLDLTSCVG